MDTPTKRRKEAHLRAVKKCISIPGPLYRGAAARSRKSGFATFSDYLQELVRRDLEKLNGTPSIC